MSGQRAVDGHPRDAGAAGHVGQRGAPQPDGEDAVAGGVEQGIFGGPGSERGKCYELTSYVTM